MLAFRPKARLVADQTAESWRERDHDDLVFAVALAVWMAEREVPALDVGEPLVFGRPRTWSLQNLNHRA
jgi:hypothetical protein